MQHVAPLAASGRPLTRLSAPLRWRATRYARPMPFTLAAPVHAELTIKKSRFLACVEPVANRPAALARVAELKGQFPEASHVCWALMAGGHSAANDDGEPSGTAGRPMLEVLRRQDLEGVLATVVRWYGGIQLGAGGLVRAYTDSVAQALLQADKVAVVRYTTLRCSLPYALEGWLRRELELFGARLTDVNHGDRVALTLQVPADRLAPLRERITGAAQGDVDWPAVPDPEVD